MREGGRQLCTHGDKWETEECRQLVRGGVGVVIALCLPLATMGDSVRSLRGHNKAEKSPAGVYRMVQ